MKGPGAPENPFSARHHAPGALPWLASAAAPGDAPLRLYEALVARRAGALIGPEGTGKSTLLRLIEGAARADGREVLRVHLRTGERLPPRRALRFCVGGAGRVLLVDSAEQLLAPARLFLRGLCAVTGVLLLCTGHAPLGLPTLLRTRVTEELARRVAEAVLAASPSAPRLVTPDEAGQALGRTGGNLREALFFLYDLYEQRWAEARRGGGPGDQGPVWTHPSRPLSGVTYVTK
jgi:hypothetical protein